MPDFLYSAEWLIGVIGSRLISLFFTIAHIILNSENNFLMGISRMVWMDFFFRIEMAVCIRKAFSGATAALMDMKSEETGCCSGSPNISASTITPLVL